MASSRNGDGRPQYDDRGGSYNNRRSIRPKGNGAQGTESSVRVQQPTTVPNGEF